jgi:hypothetical protein
MVEEKTVAAVAVAAEDKVAAVAVAEGHALLEEAWAQIRH